MKGVLGTTIGTTRSAGFGRPSVLRMSGTPIIAVMLCSALPALLPVVATFPMLPPLGLVVFVAWRLLRAELWPAWIGAPLGLWDDLFSGQPIGSAIFLWTAITLAFEFADRKLIWRDHWIDWTMAVAALAFGIFGAVALLRLTGIPVAFEVVAAQFGFAVLTYPIAARLVAILDRWRLRR